jgi:hypothetical protein
MTDKQQSGESPDKDEIVSAVKKLLAARKMAESGMAVRERATIIKVGTVTQNDEGEWISSGWTLDGEGRAVAALEVLPDGTMLLGGYTMEELRFIAANA